VNGFTIALILSKTARAFGPALTQLGRSHARRFNSAGFSFGFGGCGKLLLLSRLALRRRW
jgi:hypothetical protein